jgi:hypothetical protein
VLLVSIYTTTFKIAGHLVFQCIFLFIFLMHVAKKNILLLPPSNKDHLVFQNFRPVRLAYQPPAGSTFFSQNKPATSNQPAVLLSQNKPATSQTNRLRKRVFI